MSHTERTHKNSRAQRHRNMIKTLHRMRVNWRQKRFQHNTHHNIHCTTGTKTRRHRKRTAHPNTHEYVHCSLAAYSSFCKRVMTLLCIRTDSEFCCSDFLAFTSCSCRFGNRAFTAVSSGHDDSSRSKFAIDWYHSNDVQYTCLSPPIEIHDAQTSTYLVEYDVVGDAVGEFELRSDCFKCIVSCTLDMDCSLDLSFAWWCALSGNDNGA